ncbi:MAG: T9SS type A sorting domain-containing protein [Bacteroidetes bacterium]|nr:T9SS type A sorting domain-containing protein [Bacteroidota bacterium]
MKNFYFLSVMLITALMGTAQVSVTFQVDMTNETVSGDGVHLAGSFQGWDPAATMLSDDDMDGIYEVTLDLPGESTYEFKFINGAAWDFVEDVPPTCQVEVSGNDNRFITLGADDTEATYHVCYGSCAACGMTTVRMRVDMSVETAVSPNGVHIAGNFQGWDPAGTPMTDANGDGIWEAWVSFYADSIAEGNLVFKFINGNSWTNPNENLTGEDCADDFGNRILEFTDLNMVLTGDEATGAAPCYNACGTCVSPTMVTFRVDMTTQETVSVNGVHIAGSFQGWSPSANPLSDDDADGIWEATLAIAPGDIQFKFINGNDWSGNGDGNVDNELIVGDCAAEGSDNRALTVGTEDIVYEVCYNSCEAGCVENPDPADVTFRVDMSEEEVNANGVWVIGNFTTPNWQAGALQLTDDDADGVYEVTVNISGSATILYKFVNGDPSTGDNGVDYIEESGILLDEEGNELSNFEADGCGLPNGFGAYNRIHERSGEPEILEAVCFNKCSTCIVSVDEMSVNIFEAYPNPFSDNLTLLLSSQDATELVISDMKGRLVVQKVIPANTPVFNLNTTELSPGTYIVQLVNQGIAQGQVFVKH